MTRARIALVVIAALAAAPVHAQDGCPSMNINDVMNDPRVREAIKNAWLASHEGRPDEHEEGGWIYQCQLPNGDGTYRYYTMVLPWPPGTVDTSSPTPPLRDGTCRLVADFHTHPGGADGRDGYPNWEASDVDLRASAENGLPGLIAWGTGDDFQVFDGSYPGIDEPRDPSWTCPRVPPRPGSGTGDPHLLTPDGLAYDFQAIGDFSVVQSAGGDLEIQIRQQPYRDVAHAAVTAGLAIRDRDDRVEFAAGTFDPIVGGRLRPMRPKENVRLRSWGVLRRIDDGFLYLTSTGDRITVNIGAETLDYFIRLSTPRAGKVRGLLGNFDANPENDLQTSDGRALAGPPPETADSAHPLYATFGASWRVPPDRSLFAKPFSSTVDVASFPRPAPAPDPAAAAAATAKCAALNLTEAANRRACVFDLTVTKNDAFLASATRANHAAPSVPPTPEGLVRTDQDITGRLDRPDSRAAFSVDLPAGVYIFDERGSNGTSWTVRGPDGAELLDANQSAFMGEYRSRITVAKPGRHAIAVSVRHLKMSGQFRFRIRTVPPPVSKPAAVGEAIAGWIAVMGEEHAYLIPLRAGTYDFGVQVRDETAWNLTAPDGRGLFDSNQQEFMENVSGLTIPAAGTYTLTIRGRGLTGLGAYRVTVTAR